MSILFIPLAFLAGVLYRMGGAAGFNTKYRDLGVPCVMLAAMKVLGHFHWSLFICFGLLFGSLTTYFKKKGADAFWYNWLIVGLAYSIAMLPFTIIVTHNWLGFGVRVAVLTTLITLWSEFVGNAVIEEWGRGVAIIVTLPLLFI